MEEWKLDKIEKSMLESVYNDKSNMKSMIDGSIDLYEKSKFDHPEVENRLNILHQLKEKYRDS